MRLVRAFIIPAVVALGVAGSALAGAAIPGAVASAPIVHVHHAAHSVADGSTTTGTNMYHHT